MISFVNAKINVGLNIVRRREDGYHDLQTVFLPVGIDNGMPWNPSPFCDILEIVPDADTSFITTGNAVDCPLEKNLVWKAAVAMRERLPQMGAYQISLDKHLPDGAGMGGGSADAAFTLKMINDLEGSPLSVAELEAMALRLGADCPVFIQNKAVYAEGVGEIFRDVEVPVAGMWLAVVKPDLHISTKEAFAGVTPRLPERSLLHDISLPIEQWKTCIKNDFEHSLFPNHPELADLKRRLYEEGAVYASMTGSGASLYGFYKTREAAANALAAINVTYKALLSL